MTAQYDKQLEEQAGVDAPVAQAPSLLALLAKGATTHPDKPVVASERDTMSYKDAYELALAVAAWLREELGLKQGDTVLFYVPNRAEVPALLSAADYLGLNIAMRAPSLTDHHVADDAAFLKPSLIVFEDASSCASARRDGVEVPFLYLDGDASDATSLAKARSAASASAGETSFSRKVDEDVVLFSSGSTGAPKAIANAMSSFTYNATRLTQTLGMTGEDVLYAPVPVFHVYGFVAMVSALLHGSTWAVLRKYSVQSSLQLIGSLKPAVRFCVPTMIIRELAVMREAGPEAREAAATRVCMVAGDACCESVLTEYERLSGCRIVLSYGMTETAATLTVESPDAPLETRLESSGKAIQGAELKIDPATGEILTKTPSLMRYIRTTDHDEKTSYDTSEWFGTGDVGRLDDDGRLYVLGRLKNIIVRGGLNIYPAQVEKVYLSHPAIKDCAVIGKPDLELGERVRLFATLESGCKVTYEELRAFGANKLEKGSLPDEVIFLEAIPSLPNGKRDSQRLKEIA